MDTFLVNILNPKASKLLKDLADLELISIQKQDSNLEDIISEIRRKGKKYPISQNEITSEVEEERNSRFESKKG